MIVKPSVSFLNEDSDPELIVDVGGTVTGLTGNPSYPRPRPRWRMDGGVERVHHRRQRCRRRRRGADRDEERPPRRPRGVVRELASYVQVACKGNLTVSMSSGFPIQKPVRNPIGDCPRPQASRSRSDHIRANWTRR